MSNDSLIEELKPCPYVNGWGADNVGVSYMLKKYEGYSDFVVFEDGKPHRCFRISAELLPTPDRDALVAELSDCLLTCIYRLQDLGDKPVAVEFFERHPNIEQHIKAAQERYRAEVTAIEPIAIVKEHFKGSTQG